LKIEWAVKDSLQPSFWTFQVVPQSFPAKAMTDLLSQSPFTNTVSMPVSQAFSLVNASNTCTLRVVPAQGWIKYWNYFAQANHWDKTNHVQEAVRVVPKAAQLEKYGLNLLSDFGISRDDLAQKQNGELITFGEKKTRSYFDRPSGKNIDDEITGYGVIFTRRIDGVNFAGIGLRGGCEVEFGNDAKISDFQLVWRNLKRYEDWRTASPDEIMEFIQSGQAVVTHKYPVNPTEVKKLTITGCAPLYLGAEGQEKQDIVYPFAQLDAVADLGTNTADVQFYCPILSTNLVF
jgi:hypothetical protein